MAKTKLILAIDIGSASLKFSEFSYPSSGEMVLEKYAYVEFSTNMEDRGKHLEAMEIALNAAIDKYKFKAKQAYISISSQSTFIRFVKLPPTTHKEQKVQQLVAYEAKQNVPYPIDEVTWDYQLIESESEDAGEINVLFAVVKNEIVNRIVGIIEKKGFISKLVDISPTTCFNVARASKIGDNECVMVLNIGCTCSTLVFIDKDKFYARTIPIAGHTITQQICREFDVTLEKAEEMKRNVGFVALGGAYEEPDSEVTATISKIIRNVMTRLHGDINRSINVYRSQQKGKKPTRLYLTGGSSIINFTLEFLLDKLKMPVEYFNPFKIVKLADSVDKEELTNVAHTTVEVIGLGLRNLTTCPIEISLLPDNIVRQQSSKKRRVYLITSFLTVIFCLCIILWGVLSQKDFVVDLTKSSKKQTSQIEKRLRNMKTFLSELEKAKKRYTTTINYLKDRNTWFVLLNTIQQCLPDNTWIVELSPTTEAFKVVVTRERRSIFGRKKVVKAKPKNKNTQSNDWIIVKAHSLVLKESKKITSAEIFKSRLQKTEIFSNNPNEIVILDFKANSDESNNINTFHIKIKLKNKLPE
jgi:type IV pilus assembly protein PilM